MLRADRSCDIVGQTFSLLTSAWMALRRTSISPSSLVHLLASWELDFTVVFSLALVKVPAATDR